jgi:hypothetical protein
MNDVIQLAARRSDAVAALAELADRQGRHALWCPTIGPQAEAFDCEADELFYGGAAGSGKSELGLGLALTVHRRTLILRRVNKDAVKLVERCAEILGHRNGYNGQLQRWRLGDKLLEFAGCEFEDDKQRFKGDPHDLIYVDEGSDFLYSQYRFIIGWNRSADPNQRCRVVVGSNPPTTADGLWVIKHWAPWLDPTHHNPAKPGELRWFTTGPDGADIEVSGRGPHLIGGEHIFARSRTYIPARLSDNPDLKDTGYAAVLAGLPEELRRAYRDGDFGAGLKDVANQVIPTSWIEAAQARWKPQAPRQQMTAMAVDVAQGGDDFTVLAKRYGGWYAELVRKPGSETKTGIEVAQMVVAERTGRIPVIIDAGGGWGSDAASRLGLQGIPVVSFLGQNPSMGASRNGAYKFFNKRAEAWWRMREELDPEQDFGSAVCLPPGAQIKADLAAPTWELHPTRGIKVEDKAEIKKRLGRSPDDGDAIVLCLSEGAKAAAKIAREDMRGERQTRAGVGHAAMKARFR